MICNIRYSILIEIRVPVTLLAWNEFNVLTCCKATLLIPRNFPIQMVQGSPEQLLSHTNQLKYVTTKLKALWQLMSLIPLAKH